MNIAHPYLAGEVHATECVEICSKAEGRCIRARNWGVEGELYDKPLTIKQAHWRYQVIVVLQNLCREIPLYCFEEFRLKIYVFIVLFRYKYFNPHANVKEEYQMEKIKNTSKSKEEVEAIKAVCENNGIDLEHEGTLWKGNAGRFSSIWSPCGAFEKIHATPTTTSCIILCQSHLSSKRRRKAGAGFILLKHLSQTRL